LDVGDVGLPLCIPRSPLSSTVDKQCDAYQDADDNNHDQKFNESETAFVFFAYLQYTTLTDLWYTGCSMKKNLYISTAIPYVNGVPHIGHAMGYLLADIWARYQRQNGKEVRFQIGTDEHGTKNAAKAAELGLTPQAYVDQASQPFKAMAEKVGSSYTDFIRTTDAHHRGAVQYIWQQLAPHIYKDRYEGWYCSGCEQFLYR
jgi:leucyl-tRNA synthetase